jgi:hypothetical protein
METGLQRRVVGGEWALAVSHFPFRDRVHGFHCEARFER